MRQERAVVEELVDLLREYGPHVKALREHFDNLQKTGITERAARQVRENPEDPTEHLLEFLHGVAKQTIRRRAKRR